MAALEEEMTGVVYTEGEPITWWVAVTVTAQHDSWYSMPLTWRLCCIYTCDFFNVPLEQFLLQVGRVRERMRKGEEVWTNEIYPT